MAHKGLKGGLKCQGAAAKHCFSARAALSTGLGIFLQPTNMLNADDGDSA